MTYPLFMVAFAGPLWDYLQRSLTCCLLNWTAHKKVWAILAVCQVGVWISSMAYRRHYASAFQWIVSTPATLWRTSRTHLNTLGINPWRAEPGRSGWSRSLYRLEGPNKGRGYEREKQKISCKQAVPGWEMRDKKRTVITYYVSKSRNLKIAV